MPKNPTSPPSIQSALGLGAVAELVLAVMCQVLHMCSLQPGNEPGTRLPLLPQNVVYQNTTTSVLATYQFHKKQYRQLMLSSTDIKLPQESNLRFWPIAACWGPGRGEEQLVAPLYCQPA